MTTGGVEHIAGYADLERIGQGGFSVVYRATEEHLARTVALKVLALDAMDERALQQFQRECQMLGRLTGHPSIVMVFGTGTTESGRPYIAMEHFERGSLRDRLAREGPLPVGDVLHAGVKIASALAAAHGAGIVHRDVKPQNILVSRFGEPALADFGIARLVDLVEVSARSDALTPYHAAPETLEGRPPTAASDVYSLGSTLYQLLAGHSAHQREAEGGIGPLLLRILNEQPPDIVRPGVTPTVMAVIRQAMARRPEDRFGGALQFAERLQALQRVLGHPVTELVQERPDRAPEERARDRPAGPVAGELETAAPDPRERTAAGPRPALVPGQGRRAGARWRSRLAGGLLALALLGALGVGAYALIGRAPRGAAAARPATPPAVPPAVVSAARPLQLTADDARTSVVLHWRLGPAGDQYPLVIRLVGAGEAAGPLATVQKGTRTTTLTGLDPGTGYCFAIGALVATGSPSVISWSQPACIRGAVPQQPSPGG
jgi:serine/threonine-protein kinase PknK